MKPFADIAKSYAEAVVSGDVLACEYVQKACRRYLSDLERQGDSDFPYHFDEEAGAQVCYFIELMPHTKGRWARQGETLELEPWQVFATMNVFGWLREDGTRRFRIAYIEVPRKNGKSAWSAAIGNYMLAADGEHGAEVYSGATTQDQAMIVFDAAKKMAKKTPRFRGRFDVEVMASNLHIPSNGSKFEPIIGKPGDGASPSCAIVDEYHEHQTDELYDTMLTGMGAREQPLMWVITTAGSDTAGPCYALRSDVVRCLEGTVPNEELFGVIYTIDEDDNWQEETALRKANPNYDVSVAGDFLKAQVRQAQNSARKINIVKTKHLNKWVSARNAWMNMEAWNDCAGTFTEDDFAGEPCWIGLDLASKIDIASKVKIFLRNGILHVTGTHYLPETRAEHPDYRHYAGWVHDGHLVATEGDIIDYDRIREDILEDAEQHRIVLLGYDPYGATQLAVQLGMAGIDAVEIGQTVTHLSEPMKWIEALALGGKLRHDNNPCMNWMVSNVTARVDAKDNVFPRKERAENKIDGLVALLNAEAARRAEPEDTSSVYDERGILVL